MKFFIHNKAIYFTVIFVCLNFVGSSISQSFNYEKLHNYGRGNRVIPKFHRYMFRNAQEYPEPLPSSTASPDLLRSPYTSIFQGFRRPNDTRVYRKRFAYGAKPSGHRVFVEGSFDCIITHMAIETSGGIPILLRGGAGYHHFQVVAKAKPGDELKGTVRAYCLKRHEQ